MVVSATVGRCPFWFDLLTLFGTSVVWLVELPFHAIGLVFAGKVFAHSLFGYACLYLCVFMLTLLFWLWWSVVPFIILFFRELFLCVRSYTRIYLWLYT